MGVFVMLFFFFLHILDDNLHLYWFLYHLGDLGTPPNGVKNDLMIVIIKRLLLKNLRIITNAP